MNKKIDKKKYKKALDFTYKIHIKQNRKGTGIPYFTHLVSVSNNVIEDGGTTDEAIGGLLHDAVEDQGGLKTLIKIRKLFGNNVWGGMQNQKDFCLRINIPKGNY